MMWAAYKSFLDNVISAVRTFCSDDQPCFVQHRTGGVGGAGGSAHNGGNGGAGNQVGGMGGTGEGPQVYPPNINGGSVTINIQ
jgi:hypothetical protein